MDTTITFAELDWCLQATVPKHVARLVSQTDLPGLEGRITITGIGGDYYRITLEK